MPRTVTTLATALIFALGSSGCLAPAYRYIDVDARPAEALARMRAGDAERDATPASGGAHVAWVSRDAEDGAVVARARAVDRGEHGSRVELEVFAPEDAEVERAVDAIDGRVILDARTSWTEVELAWHPVWITELVSSFGAASGAQGREPGFRADVAGRVGAHVARSGESSELPSSSVGLALLGSAGFALGPAGAAFRPELVLAVDWQRVAAPIAGRVLPTTPRFAIELGLAPVISIDGGPSGGEATLALRHAALGGLFGRVGWLDGEAAPTWALGVTIGTAPTMIGALALLVVGALVGVAIESMGNSVGDVLGGG